MSLPIGILPLPFAAAVHDLTTFHWDGRIHVSELEPPTHIAPYAAAVDADIVAAGDDIASGRLILLHDPAGNETWGGDFRCVTFAQSDVTTDMIRDPLLAYVGWSWLTDALAYRGAEYVGESGTITTTSSIPFGTKQAEDQSSQIEIRASWTPLLNGERTLSAHLEAWQDLLREIAGLPPDETVVPLLSRLAVRR
ncbi:MAG: DUF3000 domain-containing protein [Propionibacteriaceae bacterium]|nr:DUF3000 domain-containing protein [Propionibacteriaceae bacterium]